MRERDRSGDRQREKGIAHQPHVILLVVVVMGEQCNAAVATVLFGYCAMNIIIIMVTIVGIRQINMFLQ